MILKVMKYKIYKFTFDAFKDFSCALAWWCGLHT
jgi:hypothetical protein